jgi:hypothetical protein
MAVVASHLFTVLNCFRLSVSPVSSEVNSVDGDSDDEYDVIPLIQLA